MTIQDVGLRLTSAESKGRYENYHPKSRSDTFLIVSGDLDPSTEDSGKTAAKWKVSVIDQEGRVATPSITTRIRTSTATSISWVFVVAKYEQYTLHLPGQIVVDVTPLMGRDTEASPSASGVPSP